MESELLGGKEERNFYFQEVCFILKSSLTDSSVSKESACNAGDPSLIPGLGRSPRGGRGSPLQYSCLENPHGQRAWWAAVSGVTQSRTRLKRLSSSSSKVSPRNSLTFNVDILCN